MTDLASAKLFLFSFLFVSAVRLCAFELPRRADDFVDSMGINLHLDSTADPAMYNEALVGQLGIRHFRSNVKPDSASQIARLARLYAAYGTQVNLVCDSTALTPAKYRDLMKGVMFESVEGLNEPDGVGPRSYNGLTDNWTSSSYPATLAFQRDLFNAMIADPVTTSKPVLSPAMSDPANSRYLRTAAADRIAMHSYPAQNMPTGYFLSTFALPAAQLMMAPGTEVLPVIASETGYRSGYGSSDISNSAAAKYIPRTYAEYFRLGVARTYLFELVDKPGIYNYGLMDSTFAYKPGYTAIKNLVGLLRESVWDPARKVLASPAAYSPRLLDYTITGATSNIHHVLLQKSDGTIYMLLWQEIPSYDLVNRTDITNPSVPVKVSFNGPVAGTSLYSLHSATPTTIYSNPQSVTVNVPDEVVVLQVIPGSVAPAVDPVVSITASVAGATLSPLTLGVFTVTRTGPITAPLTVYYSIGGDAINGVDYESVSGSVQISAGNYSADIVIAPRSIKTVGRKEAVFSIIPNAAYNLRNLISSKVYLNPARVVVADFDSTIQGWSGNVWSSVARDTANVDSGAGALKAVFTYNGSQRWENSIKLSFTSPQDWRGVTQLELRVKENAANPLNDVGKPVYFTWNNNGVNVSGTGVSKFPMSRDSTYRTVTLDLRDFPRDKVTALLFYVDGGTLQPGAHTLYIDSITAVTDTDGILYDSEQSGISNWTGTARSTVQLETANIDTGLQALKWVYMDDGSTRWGNALKLSFPQRGDLSRYSTLCIRFKEDSANPVSDAGKRIYMDWANGGRSPSNGSGVASFLLRGSGGYRTVELSMAEFTRDKITDLYLYLDGNTLATGKHTWYIDNITAY